MKPKDILDLPKMTRKAVQEIPKSWSKLQRAYWQQQLSRKDATILNLSAILVGLGAGYAAIGFRFLIGAKQNLLLHNQFDYHLISPLAHVRGSWIFLILPAGLLASTLITRYFASEAKGHGIPEVIEAVWTRNGYMRKRIVAFKALASSITIASGGSVGREGPIVQIGSAIGSTLGQLFKMKPKLVKTLIGCGAAGAVAATFNTPIAGVVFAIEIIVLELKTKSFVPLVISSVIATVVARFHLGNEPAFFVPEYSLAGPNELFSYLGLGLFAGVTGAIFIKMLYGIEDFFDSLRVQFWLKPIIAGLALAAIGRQYPQMFGVGYETVTLALQQESTLLLMVLFVFLKMFCVSVTLGGGGSGGVFAPSLFIGAMLGGSYGYIVHAFFPLATASYGAYALVGMAAMFSATSRATFTAIVILFEMTLDYSIILPLMFVCVTADQAAWALSKESIYSLKLKRKGLNFVTDLSVNVMSMKQIKDIMTTELHVALETMTVREVANKLLRFNHSVIPVINTQGEPIGVIPSVKLKKLMYKFPRSKVKDFVETIHAIVPSDESVLNALTKIEKTRDPRVLVVSPKTKKLVGIVSPVDFVRLSSSDAD